MKRRPYLSSALMGLTAALSVSSLKAEEAEILYTAPANRNAFVSAERAASALEARDYCSAVRAQHDANVYRSEGLASARHDEISSYAISLYLTFEDPGTLYLGHSLAR